MHLVRTALIAVACATLLPRPVLADRPVAPPMGIGLAGVSSYSDNWQFTDMMKHSREWRAKKDWRDWDIIEDEWGWPVSLRSKAGDAAEIDADHQIFMWLYNRRIAGDIVLTWEGDGEVKIRRRHAELVTDEFPAGKRRVYHWDDVTGGVFELVVARSNPADHVRNIRVWMPGHEGGEQTFHPLWKAVIEPFPYLRFMDWGATNNNKQEHWSDRKTPRHMRQTGGVAYEYMIQLCNEMNKDGWICIPARVDDDYVRQLGRLIKEQLEPGLRVYIEYSNEIWNPAFQQTRWLWDKAEQEIKTRDLKDDRGQPRRKWEYAPTLCGRRSAEIWKIMTEEIGDPGRLIRTITHIRWLDRCMDAALDPANGDGRVDLIALNGYFISQDSLTYALRDLDDWDAAEVFDMLEQQHLLGKAVGWHEEMAKAREKWPGTPISCYEGGQHFANPFSGNLQGKQLVERMFEVNADPRIKDVYRTALETWHLAGGEGFTAFVECGSWSKYGCWGHKQYPTQPLTARVDADGNVVEKGAHKYAALLEYMERRSGQNPETAPRIVTSALPDARVGVACEATFEAEGGSPPYTWSLLGGRLPSGLRVESDGRIVGTPTSLEQLVCIIDCTDSRNQHASRIMGLFMDPAAGKELKPVDFSNGLPAGWACQGGEGRIENSDAGFTVNGRTTIPFVAASAPQEGTDSCYTAEIVFTPKGRPNMHQNIGFAFCMSPEGDTEDYLRVVIDGTGHRAMAFSRYLKGSRAELWGRRTCNLLRDDGESRDDRALDEGEYWTLRATIRPGASPGAVDLLIGVFDQDGKPRLDPTGHTNVANGFFLLRELPIKDELRRGPLGLLLQPAWVKTISWAKQP